MDAAAAAAAAAGYAVRDVVRMKTFYFITIGLTAAMFTYTAVLTQLIPHMQAEGFSKNEAAAGISIVAAFGIASKLFFGRLSETITARWAAVLSLVIQSAGLVLFIVADGSNLAWVAVVVFGLGFGGIGALIPLAVADAFCVRHFGGFLGLVSVVGSSVRLEGRILRTGVAPPDLSKLLRQVFNSIDALTAFLQLLVGQSISVPGLHNLEQHIGCGIISGFFRHR